MKITTKIAALIIVGAFAATPAVAEHKKKKEAPPQNPSQMTFDQAMAYNKRNLSLFVQGLPLILPTWSLPVYFKMKGDQDKPKHGKHKRH
jgi:hypothetical protein